MDVLIDCMYFVQVMIEHDSVSEWLRRWTRNPLGSARVGSNPIAVDFCLEVAGLELKQGSLRTVVSIFSKKEAHSPGAYVSQYWANACQKYARMRLGSKFNAS